MENERCWLNEKAPLEATQLLDYYNLGFLVQELRCQSSAGAKAKTENLFLYLVSVVLEGLPASIILSTV